MARAPFDGYWQGRALPAQPHDQPYTRHLIQAFSELLPMRFRKGEQMQLTMGETNLLHEDTAHSLVEWQFVGQAAPQRVPQDWQARAGRVRAIAEATRTTCASDPPYPKGGIWQPYILPRMVFE